MARGRLGATTRETPRKGTRNRDGHGVAPRVQRRGRAHGGADAVLLGIKSIALSCDLSKALLLLSGGAVRVHS
jgi:hypothetical protein